MRSRRQNFNSAFHHGLRRIYRRVQRPRNVVMTDMFLAFKQGSADRKPISIGSELKGGLKLEFGLNGIFRIKSSPANV